MIYYILLMISIIFVDQLTKWLAVISLKGEESFPLWEGVFHFTYVENTGSAFGMLKDHRWVFMIISTVVIVAFLFIFFKFYKKLTPLMLWSISFLIAGGIGNMIDRIALGYVVDFFDFTLINFAVFNVADSFVCIGAGLLVLWFILDTINEMKTKKTEKIFAASDENGVASAKIGNPVVEKNEIETPEEKAVEEADNKNTSEAIDPEKLSEEVSANVEDAETANAETSELPQNTENENVCADTQNAETWNTEDDASAEKDPK